MPERETVSVIVPVYNAGVDFPRVLSALSALQPPPAECIIVDDGSTDHSRILACERGFCVLDTPRPQSGPASARNLGAAHAQSSLLFFVDADVLVPPGALQHVMDTFADPMLAAMFGSYDDAPADPGFISQYKNLSHHYVHQTSNPSATSFWAGCGAIRRETFLALGGFSTNYVRPSIEDIEFGYRLVAAGGHIRLVKELRVKHLKRWTLRSLLVTDIRDRAIPWAELLTRRGDLPADLNLQISHRISAVLSWLLLLMLMGVVFSPFFGYAALVTIAGLVALNFDFYRFLFKKRGILFTLGAIPLHWLYYLYSSASFAYVILKAALGTKSSTNYVDIREHKGS